MLVFDIGVGNSVVFCLVSLKALGKFKFVHEREHPFRSCEEQLLCILDSLRTKIVEKRIENLIGPEKYIASAKICIKEARI